MKDKSSALDPEDYRWHNSNMAGHEEPAVSLGLVARATRLIIRLGRYQVMANNDEEGTSRISMRSALQDPGISSSESDEEYTGGEDDQYEDQDADSELYLEEVIDSEEYNQSSGTRTTLGGGDGCETPVPLDHVLAQSTAMRHCPSDGSARLGKVKRTGLVNVTTMLAGREINVSGNGRFSRAECCHVAGRYVPTGGPSVVEQFNSRAYIGQFSADGTLFTAGFQDRRIRIYNVEKDWAVQKDIQARNLRWTVTDTALSPDKRFLVYASITPVVHLVNVGSESGDVRSLANITVRL